MSLTIAAIQRLRSWLQARNTPLTVNGFTASHPILKSKMLDLETVAKWGVEFVATQGRAAGTIRFPLYVGRQFVGYCTWAGGDSMNITWHFESTAADCFIYGLDRCDAAKALVIVESPWEVLYLDQIGGHQAVAFPGCEMTKIQEAALAPFKTIILAMNKADSEKIGERLKMNHVVRRMFLLV